MSEIEDLIDRLWPSLRAPQRELLRAILAEARRLRRERDAAREAMRIGLEWPPADDKVSS